MRRLVGVVLLILVGVMLLLPPAVKAQDPVHILEIDTYERTLAPGQGTRFNWTLRNVDIVNYSVTVSASSAPGWNVTPTPGLIPDLAPNRAVEVSVLVTTPPSVEGKTVLTARIQFTVYQDGATVFIATRTATVTIPSIFAEKKVFGMFGNPLPAPLDNEWGVFLLDVALWLLTAFAVLLILIPTLHKLGSLTKTRVADVILRIIRTPLVVLLALYGAIQSLDSLDRHIPLWIRDEVATAYEIALTIILFYVGYRLFKDVFVYLARTVAKKTVTRVDEVLVPLVEKVGLAALGLAALGLLLGYLHVDLTLFVAGGVVTSMVIAFAAQDTLSNFFSGIFLLTDRPFKERDIVILADGDWAEVRRIGMRTTRLFRYSDASLVTMPNNRLVNEKIANFSNPNDKGRVMKTFNVAYGSDVETVKRILREVIAGNPHILQEDPLKPIVRFDAMSESSLDFFILVWLDDRANRFGVQDYLNSEIYRRFNEAGIDIPFPQRTIHVRYEDGGPGPAKTAPPEVERLAQGSQERDQGRGPGSGPSGKGD